MTLIPSPQDLGLPSKYKKWRPHQEDAILFLDGMRRPNAGLMLPPGAGKSGIYMAWAAWRQKRMMVLTPSKMLQDQLYADFAGLGVLDLRGQANYVCKITEGTVADAPCHGGYECAIKSSCEYFRKLKQAKDERILISNPAFWMHNKSNLGDFDMVVFDEGHRAFEELARFSNISFSKKEAKTYFHRAPIRDWKPWASYQRSLLTDMLRTLKDKKVKNAEVWDEIRVVKRLHDKVSSLCDADPKTLIYQESFNGWTWDCVWPGAYRHLLTSHSKKYVFTSGTMTHRTMRMLGYARDEYHWMEAPSTFPTRRCPVFILPAPALNYESSKSELRLHQEVMDRFLDHFPDWRGLIHSGSFDRAADIVSRSRHSERMITHSNGKGLSEAKERFYESENGILVSPSIVEGEDFAYEKARFQVIAKLPFTNPRDPIGAERERQDRQYPGYTVAQKIQQARGRVMRASDDFGITAIGDGAWEGHFFKRSAHHFTSYFVDAITPLEALPSIKAELDLLIAKPKKRKAAPVAKKTIDKHPRTGTQSAPPLFTGSTTTNK